jgi:hypothetical protein
MNALNKTYQEYRDAVVCFLNDYEETVSEHIIQIMISVMMTRDNLIQGGSFVQAVVDNNLRKAVSRADAECMKHLRIIALCANDCYIEIEQDV